MSPMSASFSSDCWRIASSPRQRSASFTGPQSNSSVSWCPKGSWRWTRRRPRLWCHGRRPPNGESCSCSSASLTFTAGVSMGSAPRFSPLLHSPPPRSRSSGHPKPRPPSPPSRLGFPWHPSSSCLTPRNSLSSRSTPRIPVWERCCPSGPLTVRYTLVPIFLAVFPLQRGIMLSGTGSCWRSNCPSRSGVTSWRAWLCLSSYGQTTDRPGGLYCLTASILPFHIARGPGIPFRTPCLTSAHRRRLRRFQKPFFLPTRWSLLPGWRLWTRWRGFWRVRSLRPRRPWTGCTYQTRSGQRVLKWAHSSSLACHPGVRRTLALLSRRFWWSSVRRDVEFIAACPVCARAKGNSQCPQGLLQLLPVPHRPWSHIALDFVTGLPESQDHTVILTVVDRFSKAVHFIPLPKLPSFKEMAQVLVQHVFHLHGLPLEVTSDRGPQFTSAFWRGFSGGSETTVVVRLPTTD